MPRPSGLNALDVDGSFDRMKQDALEAADGDESKALDFLTGSVLKRFIEKLAAGDDHDDDYYQGPHDDLPPELRILIETTFNGTDILLVMEKKITASDLNRNQNRLLFGVNNQICITQEEKNKGDQPGGLQVSVIQPCLEITPEVELRKRTKKNSQYSAFVLTGNWFKIAENEMNHLRTNDTVRLWSFRKGSELFFALVKT